MTEETIQTNNNKSRQKLETLTVNMGKWLNTDTAASFLNDTPSPFQMKASEILQKVAEALKYHGYDLPNQGPRFPDVEPSSFAIKLGQLPSFLKDGFNRRVLDLAVKTIGEDAGLYPTEVELRESDVEPKGLSRLKQAFFGKDIYVIVPDERMADLLKGEAASVIRSALIPQ